MPRPRLLVVDPSTSFPETQGVAQVVQGFPGQVRLLQPALRPGEGPRPDTGYDFDGAVILGSRASAKDDLPWLAELSEWTRPILDGTRRLPLLGICFGHQLVAHLAGGAVRDACADGTKLVGIGESEILGGRLVERGARLRVVYSHREIVGRVPEGYRVTARREHSDHDGLEHEALPVFTFQFHPEARQDFLRSAGGDPGAVDERLIADSRRLLDAFQRAVLDGAGG